MTRTKDVLAFAATGTSLNKILQENGEIKLMIIDVPNFTNTINTTITIKDTDDNVLWSSGNLAKNTTYKRTNLAIPLDYEYTVNVDLSGAAGGSGGDVTITSYVTTQDRR